MAALAAYGSSYRYEDSLATAGLSPVDSDPESDSESSVFFGTPDARWQRQNAVLETRLQQRRRDAFFSKNALASAGQENWDSEEEEGNDTVLNVDDPSAASPNNIFQRTRITKSHSGTSLLDQTPSPFASSISSPLIPLGSPLQRLASKENRSPLRQQATTSSPKPRPSSPFRPLFSSPLSNPSVLTSPAKDNTPTRRVWEVVTPRPEASSEATSYGEFEEGDDMQAEEELSPAFDEIDGTTEDGHSAGDESDDYPEADDLDVMVVQQSPLEVAAYSRHPDLSLPHTSLYVLEPQSPQSHNGVVEDDDDILDENVDQSLSLEDESSVGEGYSQDAEGSSITTEDWEAAGGYGHPVDTMPVLEEVTEVLSIFGGEERDDEVVVVAEEPLSESAEEEEEEDEYESPEPTEVAMGDAEEGDEDEFAEEYGGEEQPGSREAELCDVIDQRAEERVATPSSEAEGPEDEAEKEESPAEKAPPEFQSTEETKSPASLDEPSSDSPTAPPQMIESSAYVPVLHTKTPSPSRATSMTSSPLRTERSQTPVAIVTKRQPGPSIVHAAPAANRQLSKLLSTKTTSHQDAQQVAKEIRSTVIKKPNGSIPVPSAGATRRIPVPSSSLPTLSKKPSQSMLKPRQIHPPSATSASSQIAPFRPAKPPSPPPPGRNQPRPGPLSAAFAPANSSAPSSKPNPSTAARNQPRPLATGRDGAPDRPGSAASNASTSSFASSSVGRPKLPMSGNLGRGTTAVPSTIIRPAGTLARRVVPSQAPLRRPITAPTPAPTSASATVARPLASTNRPIAGAALLKKSSLDIKSTTTTAVRPLPSRPGSSRSDSTPLLSNRPPSAPSSTMTAARGRFLPLLAQTQSAPNLLGTDEARPSSASVNARPMGLSARPVAMLAHQPVPAVEVPPASPEKRVTVVSAPFGALASRARPVLLAPVATSETSMPDPRTDALIAAAETSEGTAQGNAVASAFDRKTLRRGTPASGTDLMEEVAMPPRASRRAVGGAPVPTTPFSSRSAVSPVKIPLPPSPEPLKDVVSRQHISTPRPRPVFNPAPILPQDELTKLTQANTRKNKKQFNKINVIVEHMDTNRPPSPTTSIRKSFGSEGAPGRPVTKEGRSKRAASRREGKALRESYDGAEPGLEDEMEVVVPAAPVTHFRAPGDDEEYMSPVRGGKLKGRKKASMVAKDRKLHFDKVLQYVCDSNTRGPHEPQVELDPDCIVKHVPLDSFGNYTAPPARDFLEAKKEVVKVIKMIYLDDEE